MLLDFYFYSYQFPNFAKCNTLGLYFLTVDFLNWGTLRPKSGYGSGSRTLSPRLPDPVLMLCRVSRTQLLPDN